MLIPDNNPKGSMLTPQAHVAKALTLEHNFQTPPNLPLVLQYASLMSTDDIRQSRLQRMKRALRLEDLVEIMPDPVKVASATARLGLLTVLTFLSRWPGWQMTTLYTNGFKVATSTLLPKPKHQMI